MKEKTMHFQSPIRNLAVLFAVLLAFSDTPTWAIYALPQIQEVPVERLAKNLQAELEKAKDKKTKIKLRLHLARLHAMAYALKTDSAKTTGASNGAWFGYEPSHVPFNVTATVDKEKQDAAKHQLALALKNYAILLDLDSKHGTGRLGYGWCLEQSGEVEKAIKQYREVIEAGWKEEKQMQVAGLGWHSLVAESARYLMPHLDKKNDAAEIATLNERISYVQRLPRPVTPIAIPLKDNLTLQDIEDHNRAVNFDADGTGIAKDWTWISNQAAWLVSDPHQRRQVDSAIQLFGNTTWWLFWDNGYEPLAALDNNCDGKLTGGELKGLALWHDTNCNGVSEEGEVRSLVDHGIVALSCHAKPVTNRKDGSMVSQQGVTFADRTVRSTFDVILQPR